MRMTCYLPFLLLMAGLLPPAGAADAPAVVVTDHGQHENTLGPGAPTHVIGLTGVPHEMDLDTGTVVYGLNYVSAIDPKTPGGAVPGEGYIGMTKPTRANWYGGGFFDLTLNGQSIGRRFVHSFTGRSAGNRGTADFVFDTAQAVVRVRFVALAGGDGLFCQARVEPKETIKSARLDLRCYPAGFITTGDRHVLSPMRDLPQSEAGTLDPAKEWWLFCYDKVFDLGVYANGRTGEGPCAVLWPPEQVSGGSFRPAGYSADIHLDLKPDQAEYRFLFFDFHGKKNADAEALLRGRATGLRKELEAFDFTDPAVRAWSLEEKWAEAQKALALVNDPAARAKYERWRREMPALLKAARDSGNGAILAEAEAVKAVADWDAGLPELLLKALIAEI